MGGLLVSRKFWLAVFGVVEIAVLSLFGISPEIWASIAGLVVVLIGAIAHEDAAAKSNKEPVPVLGSR